LRYVYYQERKARLREYEMKFVEEVLSCNAKGEKEKIYLRNMSVIPDLRGKIVEL
jgi:hypothetical protein